MSQTTDAKTATPGPKRPVGHPPATAGGTGTSSGVPAKTPQPPKPKVEAAKAETKATAAAEPKTDHKTTEAGKAPAKKFEPKPPEVKSSLVVATDKSTLTVPAAGTTAPSSPKPTTPNAASPRVSPTTAPTVSMTAVSALPSLNAGPHLESFVCIRMGIGSELSGSFSDKFITLKDGELRMLVSLKDQTIDRCWPLEKCLGSIEKLDSQTIRLKLFVPSTQAMNGLMDIWWPNAQSTREWMMQFSGYAHSKDELIEINKSSPLPASASVATVTNTAMNAGVGGYTPTGPPVNASAKVEEKHTNHVHTQAVTTSQTSSASGSSSKGAATQQSQHAAQSQSQAQSSGSQTADSDGDKPKYPLPKGPPPKGPPPPERPQEPKKDETKQLTVQTDEEKEVVDPQTQGRLNVEMMMQGCNFILYEFQQKPGEEMMGHLPPQSVSQLATKEQGGAPTLTRPASWNGARRSSSYSSYGGPKIKAVKQPIFVFYAADETLFGSIYWGEQGTKVIDEKRRLRFHLLSDIFVGKQTPVFNTREGQTALEERCFSLISHEESKELDLEAESEEVMEQWMNGLKFILLSSGKGLVVNNKDEEMPVNESDKETHQAGVVPQTPRPPKPVGNSTGDSKTGDINPQKGHFYRNMLTTGCLFNKLKHGRSAKRLIWCSTLLDHICWGDGEKKDVRGFLLTKDLKKIARTNDGKSFKITLQGPDRTLDIEATDATLGEEWAQAFEYAFAVACKLRKEAENVDKNQEKFYMQTMRTGATFKKWPEGRQFKAGAHQVRKLITDHLLTTLYWGDATTNHVKGSIALYDIVEVTEVAGDDLKMVLVTKGRILDMEAKSAQVRSNWISALRWWIACRKESPPAMK